MLWGYPVGLSLLPRNQTIVTIYYTNYCLLHVNHTCIVTYSIIIILYIYDMFICMVNGDFLAHVDMDVDLTSGFLYFLVCNDNLDGEEMNLFFAILGNSYRYCAAT